MRSANCAAITLTEEQIDAAALADADAQPLTEAALAGMKRTPQVKMIRRALGFSQEDFALRFHIPPGTLRDWEQGRKEPDAAAPALSCCHWPQSLDSV